MTTGTPTTRYLEIDGGRIAYDDTATADPAAADRPLVLCAPGMGDNRTSYRHLRPLLEAAGYRVVTMDLRGERVALARRLDAGPALLISNSYTGGPSFIAAAQAPELFTALVLTAPFARLQPPLSAYLKPVMFVLGRASFGWVTYWSTLFKTRKPADFAQARKALAANLREPGRMAALRAMMAANQSPGEAAAPRVTCPVLVVSGSLDPDFKDPVGEGRIIAGLVPNGRQVVVEGAGHYPATEFPQETADVVLPFLKEVRAA
jgi:pimeloyl-ACP methyl ester carboxylesterase